MSATVDTLGIAEYLRLKRGYVTDVVVKQAGFPKPVINRSRRNRRWLLADVVAHAAKGPNG